jgi:hypothetical protein
MTFKIWSAVQHQRHCLIAAEFHPAQNPTSTSTILNPKPVAIRDFARMTITIQSAKYPCFVLIERLKFYAFEE